MDSIWTKGTQLPRFEELKKDIDTDVLIIGGGIAGILCAYMLKEAGVDCAVAEASRICGGITKNTTAKITVQHGLIYDKMIRGSGEESAKLYLKVQRSALKQYFDLCERIDCDLEIKDSFVYSIDNRKKIEKEIKALERIGCKADFVDRLSLPFSVAGAVRIKGQAQFDPLKFMSGLVKGLPIFENTKILELRPNGAITKNGRIFARRIIVATHFPFINKHGSYFLKMYQHRSYVIALENAPDVDGMYVDESDRGLSFRNYKGSLLLGGGGHRTGKGGGCWQELSDFAKRNYPQAKEIGRWATQDCMTLDGIPYIGQYSKNTPNMYVATGFNKWGMTSAMAAAMILRDILCGEKAEKNEFSEIFSPSRSVLHPQLAVNSFEALAGLLKPSAPRCPHMGCALKYNRQEHSWDCSCHGSRFEKNGKLIDNPAADDMISPRRRT